MKRQIRRLLGLALCALGILVYSSVSRAQVPFDDKAYQNLVRSGEDKTIPVGTEITAKNWQQYQRFMSVALRAFYSGAYAFHVPDDADNTAVIGPTITIPRHRQEMIDTEKYSSQASIVHLPNGGVTINGFVAGQPFPLISEKDPDAGAKTFFNAWYEFHPAVINQQAFLTAVDSYGNVTRQTIDNTYYRLKHLSDPPYPMDIPDTADVYAAGRNEVWAPEQTKYSTSLNQWRLPTDPAEVFSFLPSLRRVLRLSSAARCAPALGSDNVNDDTLNKVGIQPSNFKFRYLGRKRVLAIMHADWKTRFSTTGNCEPMNLSLPSPGFPKPMLGKWELRDVDVVDITPLSPRYCYGHKVIYVDTQSDFPIMVDIYDAEGP